jgi:hypothetical protein
VPYHYAQSGGAKRAIRTLKEQGVTNHTQSNLNDKYLFDAILHFTYTRQVVPKADGVSIFEDYYNRPLHPRRLLSFGCLASSTIPHELRLSHGKRAENGIVLGYDTSTPNGYFIFRENGRVITRFSIIPNSDVFSGNVEKKTVQRSVSGFDVTRMLGPETVISTSGQVSSEVKASES